MVILLTQSFVARELKLVHTCMISITMKNISTPLINKYEQVFLQVGNLLVPYTDQDLYNVAYVICSMILTTQISANLPLFELHRNTCTCTSHGIGQSPLEEK